MRRLLFGLAVLLGLLGLAVGVNTLRQGSRQVSVPPVVGLKVDVAGAGASLSAAVQARTVSGLLDPQGTAAAFEQLHAHLAQRYPRVHATLKREVVGAGSLLFTWPGSEPAAKAIVLMAHQDVAPVAPGTEGLWKQPPFSGAVEGGFVWGRGAWDDKGNLIAQLEALETLLASGFQPRRTVYLVAGHDEELGGQNGAVPIVALLKQRGAKIEFVIDEGLLIADGMMPGLQPPAALVGVAEKGFVSVQVSAEATPGHSSMPPAPGQSAIAMLSAALARIDEHPMPGGIQGVARQMFDAVAPEMGGFNRVALSNLWLFGPVVQGMLEKGASTNALMRTTTALTIVSGGNKENVLPGRADATVNFRLLPGDTPETVLAHMKQVVADERIQFKVVGLPSLPSKVSAVDSDAYRLIERTVRELFPDVVVAPGLMLGGTDARHFDGFAEQVFRFSPVRAKPADLARFHGTDERISLDNLAELIRFYHRLVEQAAR
ncbi:MAG: M20 family peptidase [Rubrivivax sp.]|nr:M20 family peptidase [Rubrivivax sp.]